MVSCLSYGALLFAVIRSRSNFKGKSFFQFFFLLSLKKKWCSIQTFLSFNVCQQVCFGTFQGSKNHWSRDKCESEKELIQIIGPVQRIETRLKKKRNESIKLSIYDCLMVFLFKIYSGLIVIIATSKLNKKNVKVFFCM